MKEKKKKTLMQGFVFGKLENIIITSFRILFNILNMFKKQLSLLINLTNYVSKLNILEPSDIYYQNHYVM